MVIFQKHKNISHVRVFMIIDKRIIDKLCFDSQKVLIEILWE